MKIAVYCSARADLPQEYVDDARHFGEWMGHSGHTLVYGGLDQGLMGVVATAAAEAGAQVVGIVPETRRQRQHAANTVNIGCTTLHERKEMMEQQADAFVALEGGIGTIDEVFSALASMMFFSEHKPIAMLNRDGLFRPVYDLLCTFGQKGLANKTIASRIAFCNNVFELETYLSNNLPQ